MTIPTLEEFSACLDLIEGYHTSEIAKKLRDAVVDDKKGPWLLGLETSLMTGMNIRPEYYEVKALIEEALVLLEIKATEILSTPVVKWLFSQYNFVEGYKSAFGVAPGLHISIDDNADKWTNELLLKYEPLTRDEAVEIIRGREDENEFPYENIEKELANLNSDFQRLKRFRRAISRFLKIRRRPFTFYVIEALRDYFYNDAERHLELHKQRDDLIHEAHRSINRLSHNIKGELVCLMPDLNNDVRYEVLRSELLEIMSRFSNALSDFESVSHEQFMPMERKGKKARERFLAYNLWTALHRYFGDETNRVTAVTNMLAIEGIDNPPGFYAVEKMIQKWRREQKASG